jgi:hypothetical protein
VRPPAVEGEGVYANGALYANMGGEPLYSNVAEVSLNPRAKIKKDKNFRIKKKFSFAAWRLQLPSGNSRGCEAGGEVG